MATVDRKTASLVAWKRLVTGGVSLAFAVALAGFAIARGRGPYGQVALGVALFVATGAWAIRDGLRLRRALR